MRIVLNYNLNEVTNQDEIDEVKAKVKDILKISSDYQHENLTTDEYPPGRITVHIFPDDFMDAARSRNALANLQDYIHTLWR